MHILVTGGTGFIGSALIPKLLELGNSITLYCRNEAKAKKLFGDKLEIVTGFDESIQAVDVVINLAGEPIANKRWSEKRKAQLKQSRIGVTNKLIEWMAQVPSKPKVFISGSATGFYGNHPESDKLDESAASHDCFSHELCRGWELAALQAEALGVRVCLLRTGVVLGKGGGALMKMVPPYRIGLGGHFGSGKQYFPWIHLEDVVRIILYLIENDAVSGAVNVTAPDTVSNKKFSQQLAKTLSRPHFMYVPAWVVKILLGESAELVLDGHRVYPQKLLDHQFTFNYSELEPALDSIYK